MAHIRRVGVIGAGTMGNGIAQVFAQSGFDVLLWDAIPAAVDRAKATIEKSLGKFVTWQLTRRPDAALGGWRRRSHGRVSAPRRRRGDRRDLTKTEVFTRPIHAKPM